MVFVPLGYTNPALFGLEEVRGGGPWGSGTLAAGDGSRQPSETELAVAKHQGVHMAKFVMRLS